jgi:hypothetical protein
MIVANTFAVLVLVSWAGQALPSGTLAWGIKSTKHKQLCQPNSVTGAALA